MDIAPYVVNACAVLAVALLFPIAEHVPPFGELVRWMDTLSYRLQATTGGADETPSEVVIVTIDETARRNGASRLSPMDRSYLAELLGALNAQGVRAVALDIDLGSSLNSSFEDSTGIEVTPAFLDRLKEEDAALAAAVDALTQSGVPVILATTPASADAPGVRYAPSKKLFFGDARAYTATIDRVIYSFPVAAEPPQITGLLAPAPTPSFAFATWAAVKGAFAEETQSRIPPQHLDEEVRRDWTRLWRDGAPLVNWRRLASASDPRGVNLPRVSAQDLRMGNVPSEVLGDKIVVIGRTAFVSNPIPERPDQQPSPVEGKDLFGVEFQALFIDNLMTQSWLQRSNFWQALIVGSFLSIIVGSLLIWMNICARATVVAAEAAQIKPPIWANMLTDGYLGFVLAALGVLIIGALVNAFFLQRGLYMLSLTLLPMSAVFEALIFSIWALRA